MNISKWFIMLAVMLALTGLVVAENSTNGTNDNNNDNVTQGQALAVRYDHLVCKVDFTNTQIDLLKEYVSVDQTDNKDELTSDMTALKVFLDSKNKDGFDAYVTETLRPDMQNATKDLNDAKKNFNQYNLTNNRSEAFKTELKDAKKVYNECVNDKEIKMAQVMETHMDNWNKQWGKVIDRMTEKNITMADAQALQKEIEAQNTALKELIASGNITKIKEFMQTYHEAQLHYAARFEVARLKGYRDKLGPMADKYNMSGILHDIDEKIAGVENYTRPGHKYSDGEFKNTWEDIKNASKDMREAAKGINDERMKERQQMMNERQNKINEKNGSKGRGMNGGNGGDQ
jgi:hypothetical protein